MDVIKESLNYKEVTVKVNKNKLIRTYYLKELEDSLEERDKIIESLYGEIFTYQNRINDYKREIKRLQETRRQITIVLLVFAYCLLLLIITRN